METISTDNKSLDEYLIKTGFAIYNKGKNSVSGDASSAFVKSYAAMAKSAEELAVKNNGTDKDLTRLDNATLKKSARKIVKNAFELDDDKEITAQAVKSILSRLSDIHQHLAKQEADVKSAAAAAAKSKKEAEQGNTN